MPERERRPELAWGSEPSREDVLRGVREGLVRPGDGLRIVAADLWGEDDRIDFVAADPDGAAVVVLVGGPGDDLELLGRGLAQRAWVEARLADWRKLAPELPLRPEAGTRLLLVCPAFRPLALRAAASLGGRVRLATCRAIRNGSGRALLVEEVTLPPTALAGPRETAPAPAPAPSEFRSGLTAEDLGLSDEERSDFEEPEPLL